MSLHYTLAIENKFTTGTTAAGGSFTVEVRPPTWIPTRYKVRQIIYDDISGTASPGPFVVSCVQLGNVPIGVCGYQNSTLAGITKSDVWCPGTEITHTSKEPLSGTLNFLCTQGGSTLSTLNGRLIILLELIKDKEKVVRA
jgi:hypothetical protein